MIIKKGRIKINTDDVCNTTEAFSAAMEYIKGDDSLMEYLLSHRSDKVVHSGKVFAGFLSECKKQGLSQIKQRLPQEAKQYLVGLSSSDRKSLAETIANYYKYDKKWFYDEKFLGRTTTRVRRYKRLDAIEIAKVEELFGQGVSLKRIGMKFGVSESTVSRLFDRIGVRRMYMRDSLYHNLFMKVVDG